MDSNSFFSRLISLTLAFVLFAEPVLAVDRGDHKDSEGLPFTALPQSKVAPDPLDKELGIYSYALNHMTEDTPPPAENNDVLLMAKQYRRQYSRDGKYVETWLGAIDVTVPKIIIQNAATELKWSFDPAARELSIYHLAKDPKTSEIYITDSHVFKDIDITTPIKSDGNFVYFATPDAIHSMVVAQTLKGIFSAAIPAPAIIPLLPGAKVTDLEILDLNVPAHDVVVRAGDGGRADRHEGSDLEATIQTPKGESTKVRFGKREVADNISLFQGFYLQLLQATNPDVQNLAVVESIVGQSVLDYEKFHEHQLAVLDEMPRADQDMMLRAVAASGQILEFETTANLLMKDSSGRNTYQALANLPRNTFSSDPSPKGEWAQANERIKVGQEINAKYGLEKNWGQILSESFRLQTPEAIEAAAMEEARLKSSRMARIANALKNFATPERMKRTGIIVGSIAGAAAAGVGVHILDQSMGGAITQWITSAMLHTINVTSQLPLMGWLKDMNAEKFFTETPGLRWLTKDAYYSVKWINSFARVAAVFTGIVITQAFLPLTFYASKAFSGAAKKSWSMSKALMNYGNVLYTTVNYPFQKGLLDVAAKVGAESVAAKGNLYKVFDANAYPQDYPQIMDTYNFKKSKAERLAAAQPENINKAFDSRMIAKARAKLIALDIVAKASQSRPGDEIDMGILQMLGEGVSLDRIANIETNGVDMKLWQELTLVTVKELTDLADYGSGPINPETVRAYEIAYLKVYSNYLRDRDDRNSQGLRKGLYNVRKAVAFCYNQSKRFMSHNVLNFSLFGLRGYLEYKKYKGAVVSEEDSKIAATTMVLDYPASSLYYAAVASDAFGSLLHRDGARIVGDQLAQIGIMAATVPADVLSSSNSMGTALKNPSPPFLNETLAAPFVDRTQTMGEAFKAIAQEWQKPNQTGFAENQARTQMNNVHGFQLRAGLDYVTRLFGMAIMQGGLSLSLAGSVTGLTAIYLFNKASLIYSAGGFAIGYAVFWPPIFLAMRFFGDSAARNRAEVLEAHTNLIDGIKYGDINQVQGAIAMFQDMYRRDGKTALPREFSKSPTEFTSMDEVLQFQAFANTHVPLPTVASGAMKLSLNLGIGTIGSTILANILSKMLYAGSVSIPHILALTAASFVASQIIFKSASVVERLAQAQIRKWNESKAAKLDASGCPGAMGSL